MVPEPNRADDRSAPCTGTRPDSTCEQHLDDQVRFKNEVLGLPSTPGDHIVTHQELEACGENHPIAKSLTDVPELYRTDIITGLDWVGGTSRTVLVPGFMQAPFKFPIGRMEKWTVQKVPQRNLTEVARCD